MSRKKLEPRVCRHCGEVFQPKHYRQNYCTQVCSDAEVIKVAQQLQDREGEYYEKWLAGVQRGISKPTEYPVT